MKIQKKFRIVLVMKKRGFMDKTGHITFCLGKDE